MKRLTKTSVACGLSLVSLAAQAFTVNDLYLGFNQSSATSDYLIDLGQPAAVGVGGAAVVDLTGDLSLSQFNATFASATGVGMGVVAGQSQFPSSYDIYATALRVGGAGNPALAGSDLSGVAHSQSTIANAVSDLSQVAFPTANTGAVDPTKGWSGHVLTFAPGSFYGDSGVNPSSAMDGSGALYEDLWRATPNNAYTYLGYFTLDLNGSASLTFTPSAAAVPEPASTALFGVAGLLWLVFRRSFSFPKA